MSRHCVVVVAVLFLLVGAGQVGAEVAVSVGAEMAGVLDVDGTEDVDTGFSLGLEWRRELVPGVRFSIGVEYLLGRGVEDEPDFELWVPAAGVRWSPFANESLYLVGRLGYGYLERPDIHEEGGGQSYHETIRGGFSGALGLGYDLNRYWALEVLYALYTGEIEISGGGWVNGTEWVDFSSTESFQYRTVAVRAVYCFPSM